jgi:hypothetical protein
VHRLLLPPAKVKGEMEKEIVFYDFDQKYFRQMIPTSTAFSIDDYDDAIFYTQREKERRRNTMTRQVSTNRRRERANRREVPRCHTTTTNYDMPSFPKQPPMLTS